MNKVILTTALMVAVLSCLISGHPSNQREGNRFRGDVRARFDRLRPHQRFRYEPGQFRQWLRNYYTRRLRGEGRPDSRVYPNERNHPALRRGNPRYRPDPRLGRVANLRNAINSERERNGEERADDKGIIGNIANNVNINGQTVDHGNKVIDGGIVGDNSHHVPKIGGSVSPDEAAAKEIVSNVLGNVGVGGGNLGEIVNVAGSDGGRDAGDEIISDVIPVGGHAGNHLGGGRQQRVSGRDAVSTS